MKQVVRIVNIWYTSFFAILNEMDGMVNQPTATCYELVRGEGEC